MITEKLPLTQTFTQFFNSENSSGILVLFCTMVSMLIANSVFSQQYLNSLHIEILGLSIEHWVNDGLMAVFFLFIGLELERELYSGELSDVKKALLPFFAALGGIAVPALIHFSLNKETPTQIGMGIPMATDIAFALGILAMLGGRVPVSLKIFLTALAVIDDLSAIIVIAVFYTAEVSAMYFAAALCVFGLMIVMNRSFRVITLLPYLIGGAIMWFLMLKSGVHATIAGVMLAFAIPYSRKQDDEESPSHKLEHFLHKPVAYLILPIFALANTGVVFDSGWSDNLSTANSLGILAGLVIGKPLGIALVTFTVVMLGLCHLP
jgi:Na+:H+ antiporter, NhaA family